MKYKLIVTDFDGTMLQHNRKVGDSTIEAIKRYREAGGVVAVNTGRMTPSILKTTTTSGVFPYIGEYIGTYNGGAVVDKSGKPQYLQVISNLKAKNLVKELQSWGYQVQIYCNDCYYVQEYTEGVRIYANACQVLPIVVHSLVEFLEDTGYDVYKMIAYTYPEDSTLLRDKLASQYSADFNFASSVVTFVEIMDKSNDKSRGFVELCKLYGVAEDEAIAVGDANNDIPMILKAGLGIAVDNASADAKASAKIIAPSCDDNPIAWIIQQIEEDRL